MIRAVFVDIDNTLISFDQAVIGAMTEGFPRLDIGRYEPGMEKTFNTVNQGLWEQMEKGEIDLDHIRAVRWNRVLKALSLTGDGPLMEDYFRSYLWDHAHPMDGALALLRFLNAQGLPVCAASNGPTAQQEHRLLISGMRPMLTAVYASEALGVSKPDPLFFKKALADLNARVPAPPIRPGEVLMLGDSLTSDIKGGAGCGMRTCWLNLNGAPLREGLPKPDMTVQSLFALISQQEWMSL